VSTNPRPASLPDEIPVFASDEHVKVYLSKTQWFEFKSELAYGERKRLELAAFKGMQGDLGVIDLAYVQALRLALYVVDWNFAGRNGKRLVIPEALNQRVEFFQGVSETLGNAMVEAIERHEREVGEARAEADPNAAGAAPMMEPDPSSSMNGSEPGAAPTSLSALTSAGPTAPSTPPPSP
jgi:hypothetical protein